eukprot:CAMPEP_0201492564 /NCGR_PEP_ID=MMETSP0151_2-20130828/33691_1 /ASSEMBLY_ACC=CAM_ASM_000257 /TAXON_ID=200890 /ORGANISM="Paramoeba atlantica, Strain 621/1 / CCAP 1560/9" /LENGTH=351 /DNA_ID=CAMNT_0047879445 /DNA_START=32 /DNA_END=1087 /DNA_ORIENTATION=+
MNPPGEGWDYNETYWPGLDDDMNFYGDESTESRTGNAGGGGTNPSKRRRVGEDVSSVSVSSAPSSPPPFNSDTFMSPQLGPWSGAQPAAPSFFSPILGGSPTQSFREGTYTHEGIPPMVLSDIPRLPPSDPSAYPFPFNQRNEMESFPRNPFPEQPGLDVPPQVLLPEPTIGFPGPMENGPHPLNPYESLKRNMLYSIALELQAHQSSVEANDLNPEPGMYHLDVDHLGLILESGSWEGDQPPVSGALNYRKPSKADGLTRAERVSRLQDAMAELTYTVDRVLNPLYEFLITRDELLQQQSRHFRQLIKQISELQPHYNDLSINFETLCQFLRRRRNPPKSLLVDQRKKEE